MLGFFIPGFPKLHRFQTHHDLVLSKMLPKLKKHMVSESTSVRLMLSVHARYMELIGCLEVHGLQTIYSGHSSLND